MTKATQPHRALQSAQAKKDDSQPVEQTNPGRDAPHTSHPSLDTHPAMAIRPSPAVPRNAPAWRLANGRSPDTQLTGHGGVFSNGDRRRSPGKSEHAY
ncbi:MAG: hypothetical protein JWP29_1924 [Rhodoferax sp.]|nr:hypothetical protein [Rhodoferax sp.]